MANKDLSGALSTFKSILMNVRKETSINGNAPEAKLFNTIGVIHYEMGRDSDAFQSFLKAYEVQRRLFKESALAHCPTSTECTELAIANTLSNLGYVYAKQGKYQEAYKIFKEQHDILIKFNVPFDHHSMIRVSQNLSYVKAYNPTDVFVLEQKKLQQEQQKQKEKQRAKPVVRNSSLMNCYKVQVSDDEDSDENSATDCNPKRKYSQSKLMSCTAVCLPPKK